MIRERIEYAKRLRAELDDPFDGAAIEVPVNVIWGEADRLCPAAGAEQLAERLPHARIAMLPGVGHTPQIEAPTPRSPPRSRSTAFRLDPEHRLYPGVRDWLFETAVLKSTREEDPQAYRDASPPYLVHPDAPPFLIFHGDEDTLVPVEDGREFRGGWRPCRRARFATSSCRAPSTASTSSPRSHRPGGRGDRALPRATVPAAPERRPRRTIRVHMNPDPSSRAVVRGARTA